MLVRPYTEPDLDALRRMHASQGFDYPFPDLSDPIFVSKLIVEDDHGRPAMASLARLTCEMYLLIDRETPFRHSERSDQTDFRRPEGTSGRAVEESLFDVGLGETSSEREIPRSARNDNRVSEYAKAAHERWCQLLTLHAAAERDLLARGLDDAHAWLPPQIARRFGRRLESLGWLRDDRWTPYCKIFKTDR